MRPVSPQLAARKSRSDSPLRYPVEAHAITNAVYKQTQADWLAGDGPPSGADFEFVADGGLRLASTIANLVSSTTGSSQFTDLNNDFPYSDALISWGGTEDPNVEVQRVIANLHPNVSGAGRQVVTWKCSLFNVAKVTVRGSTTKTPQLILAPVASVTTAATGDAVGDVTFDFSTMITKPRLKTVPPQTDAYLAINANFPWYAHPCSIVRITALKADGSNAGNVAWIYDNSITTFGAGNVLRNATLDKVFTSGAFTIPVHPGWAADTGSVGVPKISIQTGGFTTKTITFSSGNLLDLTAAPTGTVYLAGLADTPPGTSVTFRIRNDADSGFTDFADGQSFADLAMTATTTRKCQIVLTPNAAGTLTPIVRRIGMEEKVIVDLSHVAEITNYQCHVDPVTLESRPTTATLRAVKNGVADFRSTIEDLLTNYDIGKLEFRWYAGDSSLNRKYWTLIDCFPYVEDFEPDAAGVGIQLMGANALVSAQLPKYDLSGSGLETPDSTASNPGSWVDHNGAAVNIHQWIDEAVPDDTDYVKSPDSPANAAVEFGLADLADPARDTGHYVDFRMRKSATGGDVLSLVLELRQGALVKMTSDVLTPVPDEWTDYSVALSAAQAQSISDYTDLRIRLIANTVTAVAARNVQVSWLQLRVTGQRAALVYNNQAANVVYADLLSQAEVPGRYKGQGISDTLAVSKTITDSNAFDELRYLSANFGKSVISTRGAIHAVDLFSSRAATVYFPADRVRPIRIVPGFRERRPLVSVKWNWNNDKERFDDEAVFQSTPALTKLGPGRFDPEPWPEESGKYLYSGSQARLIASRTGKALGTGLIQWKFRALDQFFEVEVGDVAAIGTTRFLAKDPHSSRALRGNLIAAATITDCTYSGGFWEFTGWVQSYADIFGNGADNTVLNFAIPDISNMGLSVSATQQVTLALGCKASKSVRIATSTSAYPISATVAAASPTTLDADGNVVMDLGALTTLTTMYVSAIPYERADGSSSAGLLRQAQVTALPIPPTTKVIFLTSGTTWTVPGDFNAANNNIEAIGGGGGGARSRIGIRGGGGGGGGERRRINNFTPGGATVPYTIGPGGAGGFGSDGAAGADGTDTTFNTASLIAKKGIGSAGLAGGAGGTGGTGAGGNNNGGAGGSAASGAGNCGGGGGGGAGGTTAAGTVGSNGAAGVGGAGGAGGTVNGGAGGAANSAGSAGTTWTSNPGGTTTGPGGGGGGGTNLHTGSLGGSYGAGGGGAGGDGSSVRDGGDGKQGVIVITYTTA